MGASKDTSPTASEFRCRVLDRLTPQLRKGLPMREHERQKLHHELEIHRIELEMQNAELRQTRDEMESSLERYTDLYDFSPAGYFTLDRKGEIRAANLTGANLLGIERSRLIGRRMGVFVAATDRPSFTALLDKVFTTSAKESCEVALATKMNSLLYLHIEAVVCGSGLECRLAVIDITARRQAEIGLSEKQEELEELNRTLDARIAQAVDELRRKDQMLIMQDRLATMGEMINNIAHQWRQPLNILGLLIQQLPVFHDAGKFSRELLDENTAKAINLIQHMSRTIDDFKNFFRCDKEPVTFFANQVIDHTLSLVGQNFADLQIGLLLQTEGEPAVYGYPNEFSQVILNLLINARDALIEGKVDSAWISLHAFNEEGKTVVTVADNGGGIAEEILDRLFDPYFTTKGPDKGTGLGLFMSKTIIEKNMGGRLTVRNTGEGAEFRIEV